MRVLHLIDPGWPGGGGCTLRTVAEIAARLREFEHDVLVLGTASHVEVARRCGVDAMGSASIVGRGRTVAAAIGAYERACGPYDVIHSWTQRAGAIAFSAAPRRRHVVSTAGLPRGGRVAPLLAIARATIIVPFESVRQPWIASGFDARLVRVIAPGVDEHAIERDATIVRYDDNGGQPFVVGMLHSPVEELDAGAAMTIAARLALSGMDVRVVVHSDAHGRAEAEMVSHRLGFAHELLIVEDGVVEPWRIAGALDAAVRFGGRRTGGDLTPLLWAMAAGVPVVAEQAEDVREVIEDGVNGCVVSPRDVNGVCARLVRLHEDRQMARQMGEAGASRARESFSVEALCEAVSAEYAGGPHGLDARAVAQSLRR